MLTGFFSGISGIVYNEQKLDVTSHNLANVNTTGFRKSSLVMSTREGNPFTKMMDAAARKRYVGAYGTKRMGVFKSFNKTGQLRHTGNSMDLGIVPELSNAFFAVRRPGDTSGDVYFSRNGQLSFGPEDPSNPNSPTVLYASGHIVVDTNNQPIQIDPTLGPLTISADGVISQGDVESGEIPLYRFNDGSDPLSQTGSKLEELQQLGDSLVAIPKGREQYFVPTRLKVGEGGVRRLVAQGSTEASNVEIFHEMMEMMNATRGSSANVTAINKQIDGLSKLFQLVRR